MLLEISDVCIKIPFLLDLHCRLENWYRFIVHMLFTVEQYIDSTDRGLIPPTVSPWLYQSRAVAKRRLETHFV